MRKKRDFSFKSARDQLQSQEPISVSDLSRELQTTEDKVLLLVKEGYITLLKDHDTPFLCMVGKPKRAAMLWLQQALSPIPLVPIIPVAYVMILLDVGKYAMRTLIMEHNIQVYVDPVLGSLMGISSFHKLFNLLYPWHERIRFDRQMFFNILTGIDLGGGEKFVRPLPFDVTLEEELVRISRLPEPQRALRAMDVYTAYRDAKTLTAVLRGVHKTPMRNRVDRIMTKWAQGRGRRDYISSSSSSSGSSSSSSSATSVATSRASRSTKNPPSTAD